MILLGTRCDDAAQRRARRHVGGLSLLLHVVRVVPTPFRQSGPVPRVVQVEREAPEAQAVLREPQGRPAVRVVPQVVLGVRQVAPGVHMPVVPGPLTARVAPAGPWAVRMPQAPA